MRRDPQPRSPGSRGANGEPELSPHGKYRTLRRLARLLLPLALAASWLPPSAASALAAPVDPFFADQVVNAGQSGWSFNNPTAVEFANDGRIFVAEKSGVIKVFDSLADPTPDAFADLRKNVYNFWDRGLLGLALHPGFPDTPRVYVLYTYDAAIGGTAPRWGSETGVSDPCPNPPGATSDGCIASVRLSILTANGNASSGEQVLINDWCQQYPSHSAGELGFGADGALYVTAGDGASFNFTDYGQEGSPANPCGDPPGGEGSEMTAPTAQGGALRAQDVRTPGDPTGLDGALLRLDPNTGAAMAGNPQIGSPDANTRRIVAYGLRNAFRFAIRPGTSDIWLGDVGWSDWEEIDRVPDPTATVRNFGWPCVEGQSLKPGSYADFDLCSSLYDAGGMTAPYFAYHHAANVAGETCPTDAGSSLSGMTFYAGGGYPSQYNGSLFFADYSRKCIFVMLRGANGLPDPNLVEPFINAAAGPVQLKTGPDGDLFYVDLDGGRLRRIVYTGDGPPRAVATASPSSGAVPLTVAFNGAGSSDPDGGPLSYAWDLDGDGEYDDSSAAKPTRTYPDPGTIHVRLRVTDGDGLSDQASLTISASGSTTLQLSELPFLSASNGWGPVERDQSNGEDGAGDGRTLRLNGTTYARGLGVHADSEVRIAIPSGCTTFRAVIGVDDEVGRHGSVRFKVYADGVALYRSPIRDGTDPGKAISLDVTGRSVLRLRTGSAGANTLDHADWARARLSCRVGGNAPPIPTIATPPDSFAWHVGEQIAFSGSAVDAEDGLLPNSALSWEVVLQHCDGGCHAHPVQSFEGVAAGSLAAPDHEYPAYLELRLTATDGDGASTTLIRRLDPETIVLRFESNVPGISLTVGNTTAPAPLARTVIVGSHNSIGAPTPQAIGGVSYSFQAWSDGGARLHTITAPSSATTYRATYAASGSTTLQLSELPFLSASNGWGPVERDQSNGEDGAGDGRTLRLNGTTYARGLGVHADSEVRIAIPSGCTTFRAVIGVDDEVGRHGSVRFKVYADGVALYRSPIRDGTDPGKAISLDVTGRSVLRLRTGSAGANTLDHADWARARLSCQT